MLARLKGIWNALDGSRAPLDNVEKDAGYGVFSYIDGMPQNKPNTVDHTWAYQNMPWVMACVRAIAQSGSSVPLQARRRGDDEPLDDGEIPRLFGYVNERSDATQLVENALSSLSLHGNAIWRLERGGAQRKVPLAIYPLRPEKCEAVISREGELAGYRYMPDGGQPVVYDATDIFHASNYSPASGLWGMSDLEALEVTVNTDRQAALTNYNFLLNGATPSHAILAKSTLSPDQRKQLRDGWTALQSGAKNAGRVVTMSGSDFEIIPLGTTPRDAQYLELRKLNREEICAAFQVPPSIVGIFEYANYANAVEQRKQFWSDTMKPRMMRLAGAINERSELFGFDSGKLYVDFDFSDVEALQPNLAELASTGAILISSGQWTEDEVRERLHGLPPKEQEEQPAAAPIPPALAAAQEEPAEEPEEDEKGTRPVLMLKSEEPAEDKAELRRKSVWTAQQGFQAPFVERIGGIISEVYAGFAEEVVANIRADLAKGYKATEPALETILFDLTAAGKVILKKLLPEELAAYLAAGANVVNLFGLGIDFDEASTTAEAYYAEKALKIVTLPETLHEEIRAAIANVLENGEPLQSAIDAVEQLYAQQYGDANTPGAKRIAETEMNDAYNAASEEAYDQAGVESTEWIHSFASKVPRDSHLASHGQVVARGELFESGLRYPHDPDGGPEDTIWCRCTTAPVIDEADKPETVPVPEGYGE